MIMKKTENKFFRNLFNSTSLFTIFTLFSLVFLGSCINDDETEPLPQEPLSYISIYHVSPNTAPLNILVDNSRINSFPFEYEDYSGYLRFYAGKTAFKFTPTNASNTLADTTITMGKDSLYSLFIIADSNTVETLVTLDNIKLQDTENALVRTLHASPDTPEVKIVFTTGTIADKTIAYGAVSGFTEVATGKFSFEVQDATTEEVLATVTNVDFLSQRVYTIVVKGYSEPPTGNTNTLKVEVVQSFYN